MGRGSRAVSSLVRWRTVTVNQGVQTIMYLLNYLYRLLCSCDERCGPYIRPSSCSTNCAWLVLGTRCHDWGPVCAL
jgi:hypothetical protein